MNPDDLAGNAQNLIEGSSITYANSLCFDSEGTLYVMNNANTGLTGGQIYKVQDGEVTLFAAHDKQQRYLWYDRWPDGSYYPPRNEDCNNSIRT